jgi:ribosomal protein S18 acetylase RimI-like enzyme
VDDLPRVAELEHDVFGSLGWPFFVVRQIYDIAGSWWLLVEHEKEVWGYVLTGFQSDDKSVAWILGLGVHADRRHQGYGEALMRASIEVLRRYGADVIRLSVKPDNKPARGLYEKLGFIDHNIVENDIFGPGEHRAILTLLLPVADHADDEVGPPTGLFGRLARRAAAVRPRISRTGGPAVPVGAKRRWRGPKS